MLFWSSDSFKEEYDRLHVAELRPKYINNIGYEHKTNTKYASQNIYSYQVTIQI
jgi:hypothetical protein